MVQYTKSLFTANYTVEGVRLGKKMVAKKCIWTSSKSIGNMWITFSHILLFDESTDFKTRYRHLSNLVSKGHYFRLVIAGLYLKNGEDLKALTMASNTLNNVNIEFTGLNKDPVIKLFSDYCSKNTHNLCLNLLERLNDLKKNN